MNRPYTKLLCFLLLTFMVSSCATTQERQSDKIKEITDLLKEKTAGKSPWLNFNINKHPIIFVSRDLDHMEVYQNQKREKRALSFFENTSVVIPNHFDFLTLKKNHYLVINVGNPEWQNTLKIVKTILHEGFHHFYQRPQYSWKKNKKQARRSTFYPLRERPRYYRHQMLLSLKSYLKTKNNADLKAFSWWFKKWEKEFPEEANNYSDKDEGSAEYFEIATMGQTQKPFLLYQLYSKTKAGKSDGKEMSLSSEAYRLSPLAAMALDSLKVKNWRKQVNAGNSPLEILFKQQKAQRQKNNPQLLKEFLILAVREMRRMDKNGEIDKTISLLSTASSARLVINGNQYETQIFYPKGFYRSFFNFPGLKEVDFIPMSQAMSLKLKQQKVVIDKDQVWIRAKNTPCHKKERGTVLVFPETEVELDKTGHFRHVVSGLKIKTKKRTIGRTTWYCAL